jgi:hypothetical protein
MGVLKMDELTPAIRQYKHNDGSEGFVMAYDRAETEKVVWELKVIAHTEISKRLDVERKSRESLKENKKLLSEVARLSSVLNNRKAIIN